MTDYDAISDWTDWDGTYGRVETRAAVVAEADLARMAAQEVTRPLQPVLSWGRNQLRPTASTGPQLLNADQLHGAGAKVPSRLLLLDDNGSLQFVGLVGSPSDTQPFRDGSAPQLQPRDREVSLFTGGLSEPIAAMLTSGAELRCRLGNGGRSVLVSWQ